MSGCAANGNEVQAGTAPKGKLVSRWDPGTLPALGATRQQRDGKEILRPEIKTVLREGPCEAGEAGELE